MKKAIIIIPTYNEKENITKLVSVLEEEIFPKISNWEMEILVVDDASPDGTAAAVRELMKEYKNIHLNVGPKQGLGAAYIRGMEYAIKELQADVVFEMDADFFHDPKKIPEFLKKIDEGYDFVIGTRYSDGGSIPSNWALKRKFYSVVGNFVVRCIFMRFSIHDWTGGYRAIKKEVFLKEQKRLVIFKGYRFQVGFLHTAVQDGYKIAEVPFHAKDRTSGVSKMEGVETIVDTLTYVITARLQEIIFGKFGKFLAVGGMGFVINFTVLAVLSNIYHWDHSLANLIGAALAIFSNFNFNNLWTFKDQKITSVGAYLLKLIQFYATSAFGVIFIQTGTIFLGDRFIGEGIFHFIFPIQYYYIYFVIGTGLLLIWNFFIYSKFIWRTK